MSRACRTHALEAWLEGSLPADESAALEAHVQGCGACTHALSWLRLERAWMQQRARRTPARPALAWEQLEARLQASAVPPAEPAAVASRRAVETPGRAATPRARAVPSRSTSRPSTRQPGMALWAAAALLLVTASLLLSPTRGVSEGTESVDLAACVDTVGEAMSALELRVGACLVASPVLAQR